MIGSNHTTNEENYLLNRFARVTLGTNNIDHHRTADYAGLAAALGPNAKDSLATMADIYNATAVLLIGNDVTQQNPLVAWQIRTGVRHHGLQALRHQWPPEQDSSPGRRSPSRSPKAREAQAVRWLATEQGQFDAQTTEALVQLKAALEAETDVVVLFGADIQGAAIRDLVSLARALRRQDAIHGPRRLLEFPRRCGHGRSARPPARLRAVSRMQPSARASARSGAAKFPQRPASPRAP